MTPFPLRIEQGLVCEACPSLSTSRATHPYDRRSRDHGSGREKRCDRSQRRRTSVGQKGTMPQGAASGRGRVRPVWGSFIHMKVATKFALAFVGSGLLSVAVYSSVAARREVDQLETATAE